jgi:SAM-dependent methyltransferase
MAGTQSMRRAWDRRAEEDALVAIEASRGEWTDDEFFADGRAMVEQAMEWVGDEVRRGRMLEIGCGVGRTAVPFGRFFEQVEGVDISPRMVEAAVARGLPANVRLQATGGADLAPFGDGSLDFVFSEHVFQHIADASVIERYLAEITRVLRPGGAALLQFDTRRATAGSWLQNVLPDRMLPRKRRRHMRRYRREPAWLRQAAARAGLRIEWERGERSHWHWLLLRSAG